MKGLRKRVLAAVASSELPLTTMAGLGDSVAGALEDQPHHEPDVRFVIDDQNPCHRAVPSLLETGRSLPVRSRYSRPHGRAVELVAPPSLDHEYDKKWPPSAR